MAREKQYSNSKKRNQSVSKEKPTAAKRYITSLREVDLGVVVPTVDHRLHAIIVFAITVVVYLLTMPTVVTYEDEAVFNLLCYYGQPMHPPSYPLYSILCYPVTNLPFLSVVVAGNALSGIFGGLACVVLYLITVNFVGHSPYYGYLAGLGYGFSRLLWSQSIIQEVYTLQAFLVLLTLFLTLLYARDRDAKLLKWIALAYGLSLANHWPMTALVTPAILAIILPMWAVFWKHISQLKRFLQLLAIVLASGVLPYAYILVSNFQTKVSFYSPIESLKWFLFYALRTGYVGVDTQTMSWFDKAMFAKFLGTQLWMQFGMLFAPFIIAGFVLQWKRLPRSVCVSLSLVYISTSFLLLAILHFKYTDLYEGVFSVYQIFAYSTFALWGALAVRGLMDLLGSRLALSQLYTNVIGIGLTVALVLTAAWSNWGYNDRSDNVLARNHAQVMLETFDKDAIVFTHGDMQMPLIKRHVIDGVRSDITMYNDQSLLLTNRYAKTFINKEDKDKKKLKLIESTNKPIYYFEEFEHDYGVEDFGLYKKLRKDWPANKREITILPKLLSIWTDLDIDGNEINFDAWIKRSLRGDLVNALLSVKGLDENIRNTYFPRLSGGNFYEMMSLINYLVTSGKRIQGGFSVKDLLDKTKQREPAKTHSKDRAALLYGRAVLLMYEGQKVADLVEDLQTSLVEYPSSDNGAVKTLAHIYIAMKRNKEFMQIVSRYPSVMEGDKVLQAHKKKLSRM